MKQFSLEEYVKNPSKKVVTREGRNARIICTDAKKVFPVIALIQKANDEGEAVYSFTKNGKYNECDEESYLDLFFAREKHEGWVNVYKRADGEYHLGLLCGSKSGAEALRACNEGYTATIKIEWEE